MQVVAGHPGVVDEHGRLAELGDDLLDGRAHLVAVGDVRPDGDRLATRLLDLADGLGAGLLGEVKHRDGHPVGGEALGGARADAAGGAGHDRDSLWHTSVFPSSARRAIAGRRCSCDIIPDAAAGGTAGRDKESGRHQGPGDQWGRARRPAACWPGWPAATAAVRISPRRAAGRPAAPPGGCRGRPPGGRAGCGRRSRRPRWPGRRSPGRPPVAGGRADRPADRGQQRRLGDRDRDVVVAALDPEVARQAAAAADRGDGGARVAQQRRVGVPAEHGMLVAVRLGHAGDVRQVRRRPAVGRGQQLRQRLDRAAQGRRAPVARQQLGRVAAQRRGAGRLEADDRGARVQGRAPGRAASGAAAGARRPAGRWRSRSGRSRRSAW